MPQGDAANQRPPLPARTRALLEQQLQACRAFLEPRLAGAMRDSENDLFERARKSRNNAEQEESLAGANEIKRLRESIPARILELLARRVEHFGQPVERAVVEHSAQAGLALLAEQSQDEDIVLDDLASRAESRATLPLFELGHRYAVLGGRPVLASREQPFAPAALCACIHEASNEADLAQAARGALYRAIDQRIFAAAAQLYDELNGALREAGILANLRSFAPPRAAAPRKSRSYTPPEPEADSDAPEPASAEAGADAPGTGDAEGEEVYAALMQLLRLRRPQPPVAGSAGGKRHIPAQDELNAVLGHLQQQAATVQAPDGTLQPRNMQQLRREMLQQLRTASTDGSTPDFSPEQTDSIELMGMLFDRLSEDIASHSGNYLLSELQAPLLRVAMTDQGFFTEPGHAARGWLEKVAEASARWASDTDPDDGDPALIERIHNMNRIINRDFDGDVKIFAGMAHDLQKQLDQLAHRATVAERRAVEAARGRERLEIARTRAESLVRDHISIDGLPSLTRALLLHAWTDVLALTMLRHGEDSEDFRHHMEIAEALARGGAVEIEPGSEAPTHDIETLQEEITQSLNQVGMEPKEADLLAREAMGIPTDDPDADEDDALTRTELALKLKQRKPIGVEQIDPISEAAAAADGNEAAYAEAVERIKQLAFGTWFEFDDPEFDQPVRRKMAWFSTQTGRCLFVNRRGVRTHDTSIDHLAQSMLAGNARVVVEDQRSFVDRALARILKTLKRFSPGAALAGQTA